MFSKMKFYSIAALMLAFGVFAGAAFGQDTTTTPKQDNVQKGDKFERRGQFGHRGGPEGFRGGMGGGPMGMLRGIELTDAQKQQIHTILESNKPDQASIDQMKALHEAREKGTELTAEQKEQLKASREAQRAKMASVHQQIMDVLTAEQKQQLEQKRKEREQRFQDRGKSRRDGQPGTDKTSPDKPTTKSIDN